MHCAPAARLRRPALAARLPMARTAATAPHTALLLSEVRPAPKLLAAAGLELTARRESRGAVRDFGAGDLDNAAAKAAERERSPIRATQPATKGGSARIGDGAMVLDSHLLPRLRVRAI